MRKNLKNYEVGNTVYLHNTSKKKGTSSKLQAPWNEPFLVTARISDLVYQIQKSPKANVKCVHHDCLKPSHLKLDTWLTSPKDSVPSDDSVLDDVNHSFNQEEEVPASEIVKKSSLNNDESSLDTEVVVMTTDEMVDAVSG